MKGLSSIVEALLSISIFRSRIRPAGESRPGRGYISSVDINLIKGLSTTND